MTDTIAVTMEQGSGTIREQCQILDMWVHDDDVFAHVRGGTIDGFVEL